MATQVQIRRGTSTECDAFTGVVGEAFYDTTNKRLRMSDGSTAGGTVLAKLSETVLKANNLSDVSSPIAAFNNLSVHGTDIASASTLDLDSATGDVVDVTGTTTITAITLANGKRRIVRFTGALTLTNGANLVLPTGANITTVAGDYALFVGYASSVVRCAFFLRNAGAPLTDANYTKLAGGQNLTGGFTGTSYPGGTITGSNQTYTPSCANVAIQHITLNGSSLTGTFTYAVPTVSGGDCGQTIVEVVNGGSGTVGATLSASGYTKADTTAYNTTNGNKFLFVSIKTKNYSFLQVVALQ